MDDVSWTLGQVGTRADITKILGGSRYGGGICVAIKTSSVLLFSDPEVGDPLGYHDGWLDEDDSPVFEYTGHGQGDQTFEGQGGNGNRAVLHHIDDGRSLRLFKAVGKVPRTNTKLHRYIGRFELDEAQPYKVRQVPNDAGIMRRVIVFRLRPVKGDFERRDDDVMPPEPRTKARTVPVDVTTSAIVEPETNKKTKSSRSAAPKTDAERREAILSDAFQEYMSARGHKMARFQIKVVGQAGALLTDLYDGDAHVLYELKGTSGREDVRMAIGQLFDYRRHVEPENPRLAILLPEQPNKDLRSLLDMLDIALVYPEGGTFIGVPGIEA